MKIFMGADHGGYELKNLIREHLTHHKYDVEDVGALTLDPEDDEPEYAFNLTTKMLGEEEPPFGILICRSGVGMAMAANRVSGIRAAVAWSTDIAKACREHNDANVLCLPADFIDQDTALEIVDTFLKEPFAGKERYIRRIKMLDDLF